MRVERFVPNILTSLNLVCGFLAIALSSIRPIEEVAFYIIFATLFDFADGFAARLLNAQSELGKQLDSLADIVSFGVAPAVLILHSLIFKNAYALEGEVYFYTSIGCCVLIPVFSALRLARFNSDTRQKNHFIGLPTPANALFLICIPFLPTHPTYGYLIDYFLINNFGITLVCALSCILLVAPISLISMKIDLNRLQDYPMHIVLLICTAVCIPAIGTLSAPVLLVVYLVVSQVHFRYFQR
jgi:CDP-diacylglycerol--serine O-phosphatidyltransferase